MDKEYILIIYNMNNELNIKKTDSHQFGEMIKNSTPNHDSFFHIFEKLTENN